MSLPAELKRVQILDRVVEVLKAIRAGSSYFATPASVEKRLRHWKEVSRGPAYSVHVDSGGEATTELGHNRTETFYLNVKGVVLDEKDPATAIAHAARDIRYAIDTDYLSKATGALGTLCIGLFFDEPPDTDNGYLSLEGKGQFEQRVRIVVRGTIATI